MHVSARGCFGNIAGEKTRALVNKGVISGLRVQLQVTPMSHRLDEKSAGANIHSPGAELLHQQDSSQGALQNNVLERHFVGADSLHAFKED